MLVLPLCVHVLTLQCLRGCFQGPIVCDAPRMRALRRRVMPVRRACRAQRPVCICAASFGSASTHTCYSGLHRARTCAARCCCHTLARWGGRGPALMGARLGLPARSTRSRTSPRPTSDGWRLSLRRVNVGTLRLAAAAPPHTSQAQKRARVRQEGAPTDYTQRTRWTSVVSRQRFIGTHSRLQADSHSDQQSTWPGP